MEEIDESLWQKLVTGATVGAAPTISMILMSFFIFNTEVSKTFEGTAQFFCAGIECSSLFAPLQILMI